MFWKSIILVNNKKKSLIPTLQCGDRSISDDKGSSLNDPFIFMF